MIAEKECLFGRDRIENKEIPYRICKMICVLYSGNISEIGKGFFCVFKYQAEVYREDPYISLRFSMSAFKAYFRAVSLVIRPFYIIPEGSGP